MNQRGGTPYHYKTRERTYFFKPVEDKKQFDRFIHWLAAFDCQPKLYNF